MGNEYLLGLCYKRLSYHRCTLSFSISIFQNDIQSMVFLTFIQSEASRSLTKHRKIASSFRDTQLFEIFQLACSLLRSAQDSIKSLDLNDNNQVGLLYSLASMFVCIQE